MEGAKGDASTPARLKHVVARPLSALRRSNLGPGSASTTTKSGVRAVARPLPRYSMTGRVLMRPACCCIRLHAFAKGLGL
jgi:hypothetical protein